VICSKGKSAENQRRHANAEDSEKAQERGDLQVVVTFSERKVAEGGNQSQGERFSPLLSNKIPSIHEKGRWG